MAHESMVTAIHPAYSDAIESWRICRDAYDGEGAIKGRGRRESYLPRLGGQEGRDYENYISRAVFFPVMGTVVNGRVGQVFNKPPQFEMHESLIEWGTGEITKERATLSGAIKSALSEVLVTGRVGVLVDLPLDGGMPYLCNYKAEDVIGWRKVGDEVVSLTLLEHPVESGYEEDGGYRMAQVAQYRFLTLGEDGVYVQQVFREKEGALLMVEEHQPTINGVPLDFLPFTFVNASDTSSAVDKPPLLDMATLNVAHYRNSADYEQVLHMLAVPTPYGTGIDDDEGLETLGPLEFKAIRNENAKLGLLEFSGAGTAALKEAMEEKMAVMTAIGGALVQGKRSQVETAETARIRAASENSTLETICESLEQGFEQVLRHVGLWMGIEEVVTIRINRDFINEQWSPAELKAITEAELMGVISKETAFYQRQLLELYPEGRTFEEEQDLIAMRPGNLSEPEEEEEEEEEELPEEVEA